MALSSHQKQLLVELEQIAQLTATDYPNIGNYASASRTVHLHLMKQKLIRSEVILKYTLIDEYLNVIICDYFFGRKRGEVTFGRLWRAKKFRNFNYYIIDNLYLLPKANLANAIERFPRGIMDSITRINDLRNSLAHSFFPENRRSFRERDGLTYREVPLYSLDGLRRFQEDVRAISDHLSPRCSR